MKQILLITRGIPSKKSPVWGNFELDQAKALQTKGYRVVCMSVDRRIRLYWRKIGVTHTEIEGVHLYNYFFPLPYRFLPRKIHNYIVDLFAEKLFKYISREMGEFDLIHGHYLQNSRIATVLKDKYNIPVVATEHWSDLKKPNIKTSIRKDAMETYSKIDSLISVSYPLQRTIRDQFGFKSVFIGCVIDDVFDYIPKQNDGTFRFINVGALISRKGFDVAIHAFHKANFDKNVKFHLIGEGRLRNKLQGLIERLNLSDQVFLEGQKSRKEIMEYMSCNSAYVLSSKVENFATACMEALSAGLPAVMTKCGGPEDFVDDSCAVLVEVDDVEQMAKGMRYVYENYDKYEPREISKRMRDRYSANSISNQLDKIYKQILL